MSTSGSQEVQSQSESEGREETDVRDLEQLENRINEIESVAESASKTARRAMDRNIEFRKTIQEQEEQIEAIRDENQELRAQVEQLRDRTGLLEHVQDAASLKPEKRAAILIQTLYNSAWKRKQNNANSNPSASMDYNGAETALGGGISRDKIYTTFAKAEQLVDDTDVVRYVKENRGSDKNTRLVLDLSETDAPSQIAGRTIEPPEGR